MGYTYTEVLNLIITGLPSIHSCICTTKVFAFCSFKPYYNWITFNTVPSNWLRSCKYFVLNLIITGLPSILTLRKCLKFLESFVLNLIITGLPSIRYEEEYTLVNRRSFKPYYNWITFNTSTSTRCVWLSLCFKPYYNWITFNTSVYSKSTAPTALSFKPYYNWITFNTLDLNKNIDFIAI